MALITYAIPGVTLASGRTAYGSSETVAWLPVFIRWAKVVHGVDVVVIQAAGGATASAGTHTDGCAIDIRSWNIPADKINAVLLGAREAGGWAWLRTKAQGFDPHIHIALDCDRYTACSYQVAAAKAGYNGLGTGGRGGRDDGPRPSTFRIWSAGVRWLQADIDRHLQEDDMAMTPTERAALIADIAEAARAKIFEQRMSGPEIDPARKPTLHDYLVQVLPARTAAAVHRQWLGSSGPTIGTAVQGTYRIVRALADRAGVDIDEAAIAEQVAALVAPIVRDAVVDAATAGGSPEAVADAVVAKLAASLQD